MAIFGMHIHSKLITCTSTLLSVHDKLIGNLSSIWPLFWDFSNTIKIEIQKRRISSIFLSSQGNGQAPYAR